MPKKGGGICEDICKRSKEKKKNPELVKGGQKQTSIRKVKGG